MYRQVHGDTNGSRTPENTSVMPDSPARGTEPRMGKPEMPKSPMDAADMHAHMQSITNLSIPANMSASPNLPARGAKLYMDKPEWPLESQMDVSDMCTHVQRVVNDSHQLQTYQNMSAHPETARRNQTYLVQAQNCAQRSRRGWGMMQMHGASTRMHT